MRSFVFVCIFGLAASTAAQSTDKYYSIDVEVIIGNPRVLQTYVKCIFDQGKCSEDGKFIKSHLQEILETHCAGCNEIQVASVKRVMKFLINKEPQIWKRICDKYDPNRLYAVKYEEELREDKD